MAAILTNDVLKNSGKSHFLAGLVVEDTARTKHRWAISGNKIFCRGGPAAPARFHMPLPLPLRLATNMLDPSLLG